MSNHNTLRTKAMLVTIGISYWTAKASDDRVTDEISAKHKTEKDQHDYKKILVKPDAINEVKAVRSRARSFYFEKTLPWLNDGSRILPSVYYKEFSEKMHEFRGEYEQAVSAFVKKYSALKGEARKRLGSLFQESDYPTEASLRSKFSWDMAVFPIPDKDDWRVDVGTGEEARIKKQIDERIKAATELATRDLFMRLHKVVKALSEKMKEAGDPTYRDSIIGNIRDVCGIMGDMNIADDPELDKMVKRVQTDLGKLNPEELREDKKARKAAADSADDILAKMAGYMGK